MESQRSSEQKGEEFPSYVSDKRMIGLLPMFILVLIIVLRISWTLYKSFGWLVFIFFIIALVFYRTWRQKTRSPQQRRMLAASRARPSLGQQEPSIYVNPSNFPPPPKYECMAPPSYEEVVGIHYPNYQPQPITQPITTALAATSADNASTNNNTTNTDTVRNTETVVNVPRTVTASS